MKSTREIKNHLYGQVARIAKSVSSPKRLELVEILCQGPKSVEKLAEEAEIGVKLASAHLKELRTAHLVETRREGKKVFYRLSDPHVADLWVRLRMLSEERLPDLETLLQALETHSGEVLRIPGHTLLDRAKNREILLLDVRPVEEYEEAHLPHAHSLPVEEIKMRLAEIPSSVPVVLYCRGPFCFLAKEALEILLREGRKAFRLELGVAEWRSENLPLAHGGS